MYCKLVNTDNAVLEQQQMLRKLYEAKKWMKDSSQIAGYVYSDSTLDEAIEDMVEPGGDTYEVVVRIHLTSGHVIELHNNCFERATTISGIFGGDNIYLYKDGEWKYVDDEYADNEGAIINPVVEVHFNDDNGNFHQSKFPISQVVYIDTFSIELDWKDLWSKLSHDERERRRKLWLEHLENNKKKRQ